MPSSMDSDSHESKPVSSYESPLEDLVPVMRNLNVGPDSRAASPSKASFLGLPVEIRLEMYRHLLSSEYIRRKLPEEGVRFETTLYSYRFHKEILCTNRRVYQEALHIFQMENLFCRFTTDNPFVRHILWESQRPLFLARGDRVGNFSSCAMEINHRCPSSPTTGDHEQCGCAELTWTSCLLLCDQLPDFLRTLRVYSQQGDRSLAESSFSVQILYDFAHQSTGVQPGASSFHPGIRNLLDPFKLLYAVVSFDIRGPVDEEYKQLVISSATQPEPTVAEIITTVWAISKQGDEAFRKREYDLALSLYTAAIRDVRVNHYRVEYTGTLTTGEYAEVTVAQAIRLVKIRLHANMAAALVSVGEYARGIDYARVAIAIVVDYSTPPAEWYGVVLNDRDRARPFYWGGLAYERLGDLNRAIYGVGEAMWHRPGNETVAREYKRLEREIEKQGIEVTRHQFGKGTNWWVGALP